MKFLKIALLIGVLIFVGILATIDKPLDTIANIRSGFPFWIVDTSIADVGSTLTELVSAGRNNFSNTSGLRFFGVGATLDTIINPNIDFVSRSNHSLVFLTHADTVGSSFDSVFISTHVFADDSCIVRSSKATTVGTDTGWYAYFIMKVGVRADTGGVENN
ncbi:MAG TPA: hypothetical protein ENH82_14640 [bacterium]|nr:hypothetical protein [bacterium]